jgi:hypothetical protein
LKKLKENYEKLNLFDFSYINQGKWWRNYIGVEDKEENFQGKEDYL